jgi:hypothetical protein
MKLKLTVILFTILASQFAMAQENKRNQKDVVHDKRIYFYLDEESKQIKYFVKNTGNDGATKIADNDVFSLKNSNECNIFFKWLNPLNYRIAFKDTVYVSPSDIAINDFFKSYLNAQSASIIESSSSQKSPDDERIAIAVPPDKSAKLGSVFIGTRDAFKTKDLNILFIQILNSKFESSDSVALNELLKNLRNLEGNHTTDLAKLISKQFDDLKNIKDYTKVLSATDDVIKNITNYENTISENEKDQKQLDPLKFVITNKPIEALVNFVVKDFIKEVKDKVSVDKELIQKLKDINQVLIKSVSSEESKDFKGYFQIKSIDFKDNQNFETSFIVSKYEIDNKKYEIIKKSDLLTRRIIFEKYDPVKISISTGIFYANFNLKGFGVAQGTNKLTVTEDDITSNTAIPATFLNFLFDIGSRNLLPILQMGADPTKKRPFFLLGGGLGIPSSRFAITAGPIWTWEAKLSKLSVGQEVASTSELEKDIKYTFNMNPKGWYLGLQYNF